MQRYSLKHLTEGALHTAIKANAARERDDLAIVIAHIAEIDDRQCYRQVGYPSMLAYCIHELHYSRDSANKRIRVARTARGYPAIFERVAEGALGLSMVNLLASYLTPENAEELLASASFRPRTEVEELLAARFPQAAVPTTIEPIGQPLSLTVTQPDDGPVVAPGPLPGTAGPPQVAPLAEDLYKLQLTMRGAMYEKLRTARMLLAHRDPVPDEAAILELGLDLLVAQLQKRKFGATDRPRAARRSKSARHIPNEVKRQVWERDRGQCAFVSHEGVRCPERSRLEYEHIVPVARGGTSEPSNICLHCRAHNQLEAEQVYGRQFMEHKRARAKAVAAQRKAERETEREQAKAAAAA